MASELLQVDLTTMDTKDTKTSTFLGPNDASHVVIGCALRVHTALGCGILESAICACLLHEMRSKRLHVENQVHLPIEYDGVRLSAAYRVDFIVEKCLIVEVKCVERLMPIHHAQVLSYLKLSGLKLGLLLNFNVPHMTQGIRRVINGPEADL